MADPEVTESKAPPKRRRWTAPLAVAVVLLAVGAWLLSQQRGREKGLGDGSGVKSSLHLETFVVNLSDHEQRSYLRVGIDLGLGRQLGKAESAPVAVVRDTILGVLAQCRADELLTPQGKAKLKQDLLSAFQQRTPGLQVQEVYFNEFLIQR